MPEILKPTDVDKNLVIPRPQPSQVIEVLDATGNVWATIKSLPPTGDIIIGGAKDCQWRVRPEPLQFREVDPHKLLAALLARLKIPEAEIMAAASALPDG